jgi:hypothetical protein
MGIDTNHSSTVHKSVHIVQSLAFPQSLCRLDTVRKCTKLTHTHTQMNLQINLLNAFAISLFGHVWFLE